MRAAIDGVNGLALACLAGIAFAESIVGLLKAI
jgi:hypothetical protein